MRREQLWDHLRKKDEYVKHVRESELALILVR